jgi:hypothetical protein
VEADKGQPGTSIGIQVFNPAFANVGFACTDNGIQQLYAAKGNDPRYAPGNGPFCTGDSETNNSDEGGNDITFYYQVLDYKTKQPIAACPAQATYPPFEGNLAQYANDANFLAEFREWVDICAAPYDAVHGSKYLVRVQVDVGTSGVHAFSLRAGLFDGGSGLTTSGNLELAASQQSVRVFAAKDLPLWANFEGGTTKFAIASVPPSYAGQTVKFQLFDLGDASEAATLSLIANGTTANGASPTANCTYTPPQSNTSQALPNCTLTGVQHDAGFNGQVFTLTWQVPSDYTCDATGATPGQDCFLFLQLAYPDGSKVTDRTTWSASGSSTPIRLVNRP